MNSRNRHNLVKGRRKKRVRAKISGTSSRPRLSVFRSNNNLFLQLIDDENRITLISASTSELNASDKKKNKTDQALIVAALLAKKAKEKKITTAVFDRGHYSYHGRIKAIADTLRKQEINL